jgi:hypothetical protein
MAVHLNRRAFEHARSPSNRRQFMLDDRDAWSDQRRPAESRSGGYKHVDVELAVAPLRGMPDALA